MSYDSLDAGQDDEVDLDEVGARIGEILTTTLHDTVELDLEGAIAVLQERLAAVDEIEFETSWCREALTALRRGDSVEIELG